MAKRKYPPYQSGLLGQTVTQMAQARATGGRPLTRYEMRGFLDPVHQADAQRARDAGLLELQRSEFNQQMALRNKIYEDQAAAAKVSGITDLLGLGLSYKLGSQQNQIMKGLVGGAANEQARGGVGEGIKNLLGIGGGSSVSAYTPAAEVGGFGAEGFIPGGAGGALPGAGPIALAAGGGLLGSKALQGIGVNKDISEGVSYTAAGAALGSVFPGIGTLAGGAIGLGISLIDDVFGGLF